MAITYEKIASTTLSSTATSITLGSIPATFTDLRLVIVASAASGDVQLQLNGDTGTNYARTYLYGTGSAAGNFAGFSTSFIYLDGAGLSSTPKLYTVDLFSYAGSTRKTLLYEGNEDNNGSGQVLRGVALWGSTSAITSIYLYGATFAIGTTATLYGIKAA